MIGGLFTLLLNVLIAILLAVTIAYCWILNRRIKVLQDSRSELAILLKHFDESTQRASESIIALQTASKKIGENIQLRIDKANYLLDDLAFMIEKGNKLASQMEAGFAVSRARTRAMAEQPPVPIEIPEPVEAVPVLVKTLERPETIREKTSATLGAVLEKVAGRAKPPETGQGLSAGPRERPQSSRTRSRAEQELLDMIKAGIKG